MPDVFHFTDSIRFPWILDSGELRPGRGTIANFPKTDFLWATTDSRGSATAALMNQWELYKRGLLFVVRITLSDQAFMPWPDCAVSHPEWTDVHIQVLEKVAREYGENPQTWRCSESPIGRDSWLAVEYRSYTSAEWVPLTDERALSRHGRGGRLEKAIRVGQTIFSAQFENTAGTVSYAIDLS
jgi:hypothetical protein